MMSLIILSTIKDIPVSVALLAQGSLSREKIFVLVAGGGSHRRKKSVDFITKSRN
jgi:hypothetical protein